MNFSSSLGSFYRIAVTSPSVVTCAAFLANQDEAIATRKKLQKIAPNDPDIAPKLSSDLSCGSCAIKNCSG